MFNIDEKGEWKRFKEDDFSSMFSRTMFKVYRKDIHYDKLRSVGPKGIDELLARSIDTTDNLGGTLFSYPQSCTLPNGKTIGRPIIEKICKSVLIYNYFAVCRQFEQMLDSSGQDFSQIIADYNDDPGNVFWQQADLMVPTLTHILADIVEPGFRKDINLWNAYMGFIEKSFLAGLNPNGDTDPSPYGTGEGFGGDFESLLNLTWPTLIAAIPSRIVPSVRKVWIESGKPDPFPDHRF